MENELTNRLNERFEFFKKLLDMKKSELESDFGELEKYLEGDFTESQSIDFLKESIETVGKLMKVLERVKEKNLEKEFYLNLEGTENLLKAFVKGMETTLSECENMNFEESKDDDIDNGNEEQKRLKLFGGSEIDEEVFLMYALPYFSELSAVYYDLCLDLCYDKRNPFPIFFFDRRKIESHLKNLKKINYKIDYLNFLKKEYLSFDVELQRKLKEFELSEPIAKTSRNFFEALTLNETEKYAKKHKSILRAFLPSPYANHSVFTLL